MPKKIRKAIKRCFFFLPRSTVRLLPSGLEGGMRNVEKAFRFSILQSLAAFDAPHSAFGFLYHRLPAGFNRVDVAPRAVTDYNGNHHPEVEFSNLEIR
jgi:hypothetical protein